MSALHHDQQRIFNQLPCFVKTYRISIYSATTRKISCKLLVIILSELWKKTKRGLFYETPCK